MVSMDEKTLARFAAKYVVEDRGFTTPCWVWSGSRSRKTNYGRLSVGGRAGGPRFAHVISYEHFVGPVPATHEIAHACGVSLCCNWEHLAAVEISAHRRETAARRRPIACPMGHSYAVHAGYVATTGARYCRACSRLKSRLVRVTRASARGRALGVHHREKTVCIRGHIFDVVNTRASTAGARVCRACRALHQRARHGRMRSSGAATLTASDILMLKEMSGGRCAYCLSFDDHLTVDHVEPLVRHGAHAIDNCVMACVSCNSSKKDRGVLVMVNAA